MRLNANLSKFLLFGQIFPLVAAQVSTGIIRAAAYSLYGSYRDVYNEPRIVNPKLNRAEGFVGHTLHGYSMYWQGLSCYPLITNPPR